MDTHMIEEFLKLVEAGSFRKAASELFISHSMLSRHISSIEEELQTELIDRSTKPMTLTKAGICFKNRAECLIKDYERLCEDTKKAALGKRSLKIGVPTYAYEQNVGKMPMLIRNEYPELEVSYMAADPDHCLAALQSYEVDAFITAEVNKLALNCILKCAGGQDLSQQKQKKASVSWKRPC